jgi:hypothetical protein
MIVCSMDACSRVLRRQVRRIRLVHSTPKHPYVPLFHSSSHAHPFTPPPPPRRGCREPSVKQSRPQHRTATHSALVSLTWAPAGGSGCRWLRSRWLTGLANAWLLVNMVSCALTKPIPVPCIKHLCDDLSDAGPAAQGSGSANDGPGLDGTYSTVASSGLSGSASGAMTELDASAPSVSSSAASASNTGLPPATCPGASGSHCPPQECPPCGDDVCDEKTLQCVQCVTDKHCTSHSDKPFCVEATQTCEACETDADCPDAKAARCDAKTKTCTGCRDAGDLGRYGDGLKNLACQHVGDTNACAASGQCVECTAESAQCDGNACDVRPGAATYQSCSKQKRGSAGVCEACVNSEQCKPGLACVKEEFKVSSAEKVTVGYFCISPNPSPLTRVSHCGPQV